MKYIYIDFETRSSADLKKVGATMYFNHPTTEILCFSYKIGRGKIKTVSLDSSLGEVPKGQSYSDLASAFLEKNYKVVAHSAYFEFLCMQKLFGHRVVDIEQFVCTQALASYYGIFPNNLNFLGEMLVGEQKHKEGLASMHLLNNSDKDLESAVKRSLGKITKENTKKFIQERLTQLYDYCEKDVELLYKIHNSLPAKELPEDEQLFWQAHQETNNKGLGFDTELAERMANLCENHEEKLNQELVKIAKKFPKQKNPIEKVSQKLRIGKLFENTGLQGVSQAERNKVKANPQYYDLNKNHKKILELLDCAGTGGKKAYTAGLRTSHNGNLHDFIRFYGTHTGRSKGSYFNILNLPTPSREYTEKEIELIKKTPSAFILDSLGLQKTATLIKSLARYCIKSKKGMFFIFDYEKIELLILLWLAEDYESIEMIKNGECLYSSLASDIFEKPINKNDHPVEYKLGKNSVLGNGYGQGYDSFERQCKSGGLDISRDLVEKGVDAFRKRFSKVVDLWYSNKRMFERDLTRAQAKGHTVSVKLPSGRHLRYPMLEKVSTKFGEQWGAKISSQTRILTPGLLIENKCQAICRDIMKDHYVELYKRGLNPVWNVYDEIACDIPKPEQAKEILQVLKIKKDCYKGLPINVDWAFKRRYTKI